MFQFRVMEKLTHEKEQLFSTLKILRLKLIRVLFSQVNKYANKLFKNYMYTYLLLLTQ